MPSLDLPDGYYDLPNGKLANLVTYLEMLAPPDRALRRIEPPFRLVPLDPADLAGYRALYSYVGDDWMWFSRAVMDDDALHPILAHPAVEPMALCEGEEQVGLVELDFRTEGECELGMLGLAAPAIGRGIGRALLDEAITRAFAQPIRRFWLHTCTLDSPEALPFYIRSGFTAYARKIEIHRDHRLTGKLRRSAAPHIPIIE
jgi:GNAT superfamily N-acetyltransferase